MALLAAWCAMRFGELAEVRRGDIDLCTSRVKIRRAVVRVDGEFIVGQPKSDAGIRDVAIPPHMVPLVKDHLSNNTAPGRDALLFPRRRTTTGTWPRRRSTRFTTRPGRPRAARTSVGTTSATRGRCWRLKPERRWPS
jgi:integrase